MTRSGDFVRLYDCAIDAQSDCVTIGNESGYDVREFKKTVRTDLKVKVGSDSWSMVLGITIFIGGAISGVAMQRKAARYLVRGRTIETDVSISLLVEQF